MRKSSGVQKAFPEGGSVKTYLSMVGPGVEDNGSADGSASGNGSKSVPDEPAPIGPNPPDPRNRDLRKNSRYEKTVRIVTQKVHRSLDLNDVIDSAVDVMSKHIENAQNVSIYMVEGNNAVVKSYRGYPDKLMKELAAIPYPKGFTWKTILESKPVYCPDVDQDTVIGPLGRELGTKSYVSMPICHSEKAIGCININSVTKNAFDKGELDLLEIVASSIEAAINNARRAEALKKSRGALRENVAKLRRKNRFE